MGLCEHGNEPIGSKKKKRRGICWLSERLFVSHEGFLSVKFADRLLAYLFPARFFDVWLQRSNNARQGGVGNHITYLLHFYHSA